MSLSWTLMACHLNFWTVDRLPSSVVLDDDENRGDDVEAYASPRTRSRGYQPLSTDVVSIASRVRQIVINIFILTVPPHG